MATATRPARCWRPWRATGASAACSTASTGVGCCSVSEWDPSRLVPLKRGFYARATTTVARELLGKLLVRHAAGRTPRVARIVEVEAYLGERDAASHARRGPTPRAAIMFGPPGRLYVYLIYGMHHCMNFVCETDGVAGAGLIPAPPAPGDEAHPPPPPGPGQPGAH